MHKLEAFAIICFTLLFFIHGRNLILPKSHASTHSTQFEQVKSTSTQSTHSSNKSSTSSSSKTSSSSSKATSSSSKKKSTSSSKEEDSLPSGKLSDWNLQLVNNDVEVKLTPKLVSYKGFQVDERILPSLEAMMSAAEKDGVPMQIVSAYRSVEYQEQVIKENIQQNLSSGMTQDEAEKATYAVMTKPGHSEHHTGLAVDIVDQAYYNSHTGDLLVPEFSDSPGAKWLKENCSYYGFILRYPDGEKNITGIDFEPWHFRYVGMEHARYITDHHLTLEEYLKLLKKAGR